MPFVFGLWSVRRDLLETRPDDVAALAAVLHSARAWGAAHREAVIDAAFVQRPFARALYDDYFTCLSYTLSDRARRGLDHFAALLPSEGNLRVAG